MRFRPIGTHSVVYFAFLACLAGMGVQAQEPSWNLTGPAFSASAEELRTAAAKVPAEKFTEATVLFERDAYSFDTEGRSTYKHSIIYRIESEAGVEDWAETRSQWEPWYQNQPEIQARVISADGKVSTLDQKTVTDGPANENSEDTYTDSRVRKAPLPGLAVGAIVEQESTVSDKQPFFSGGGVYRDEFWRSVPIIHCELLIDVPEKTRLQYRVHLLQNVKTTDSVSDGVRHVRFVQDYLKPRAASDIDLPSHAVAGPMIEFSTGESWAAVAMAYRTLAEAHIDPDKVKSLLPTPGANRKETIERIVARLHKDIRYTGIEFGEASLQPATAAEVLKRHYGDCKDKAAFLAAMLRAAGIPANIALLATGPGMDVNPDLPGMNEFDHAITYVPATTAGGDPLWIDATAEYAQVGTLPSMDEARLALIIGDGTTSLISTPQAKPEDDQLTEVREVTMAEYGSAHITETSLTHGEIDASYRADYGDAETREKKTSLEKYAKDEYLAKSLASVTHGEGKDLTKPFALKLDMLEAKRGNTLMDDAAVAIPFSEIFVRLPNWFKTDPKVEGEKLTPQQEENRKRATEARLSDYDVHPFVTEWRYKVTPPEGFVLRALPEDKTTAMGPARLTQHYETDPQGIIHAVLRFDTGKPRYTVEEALALREAVLASYKQDMILIMFDQAGSKLLAAGKTREALATDRGLIEKHPKEALHHAQMAYAFLGAGMGGKARLEAEQATRLEPSSAVGFKALGWICQFNEIGVQYARGFDRDCAIKAYKRAVELDPDDSYTAINLAIIEEYDGNGERYTAEADMADAIAHYRAVKQKDKPVGDQYNDNILFDLLYSRNYKELIEEVEKLPSSVTRQALAISATVAMEGGDKGVAAGIARADHLAAGAQDRNSALSTAGNQLLRLRLYPEAAGILSAAVEGQSNSSSIAQQIGVIKTLTPWKREFLPDSDPRSPVQHMVMAVMSGTLTDKTIEDVLSRHAYNSDVEWQRNLEKATEVQGFVHTLSSQTGLPANVLLDTVAGNLKITAEGDDESGHRISVQSIGAKPQQFFVTKEDGKYKIVTGLEGDLAESGNQVLYLLSVHREKEARSLLDWTRGRVHRGGGDDPLAGPLFPRFWTAGDQGDAAVMRLAAAALLVGNQRMKELIPELRNDFERAGNEEARLIMGLLLANAYAVAENGPELRKISEEILSKYPDSYVALSLAGRADEALKDWTHWGNRLDAQIAKHPDDENLLHLKVEYAEIKGDFALARATEQIIIDKGKGTANDYNSIAWSALFDAKVDGDTIKAAQQATMLAKNSFAELHTLACIYAFQGKSAEARDALLKAMTSANLSEPNSETWYGFGSIYEQYGVNDAAIAAYKKVERPEGRIGATSTYVLAQARLKALGATND